MTDEQLAQRAATALLDEATRVADTESALASILSSPRLAPIRPTRQTRRRWAVVAAATTVAAATIGTVVVVSHREDRTPAVAPDSSTPASEPTRPESTVPPTAATSSTTSATSASQAPTTTTTSAPAIMGAAALVAADPGSTEIVTTGVDGTWVQGPGGAARVGEDPFAIVLRLPDGRFIGQRRSGFGDWPPADTVPLVWSSGSQSSSGSPSSSATELWPGRDFGGWVVLHDVNVVSEDVIVLLEVQVQPTPDGPANDVRVEDLTDGTSTVVGQVGGWEAGTGRLHVAISGWIVGEGSAEVSTHPIVFAMHDDVPPPETLGLVWSTDCEECPHGFTISHDSSATAWLAGKQLVVHDINASLENGGPYDFGPYDIGDRPDASRVDIDLGPGVAVVSFTPYDRGVAPVRSKLVELATGRVVELAGSVATTSAVAQAPFDVGSMLHPVIDLAGCTDPFVAEHSGRFNLFARVQPAVLPTQLIADPALGIRGPYVIVQRYFTNQRLDPGRATSGVDVGGQPARVFVGPTGSNELQVLTADGSEMYVRGRGFDAEQLVSLAQGLTARPTDASIPGFDFTPPAASGLTLLDETVELTGATTRSTCTLRTGGTVTVVAFVGSPVFQYATSLDTAGVALMATGEPGTVFGAIGPEAAGALRSLRSPSDTEWDQLLAGSTTPSPPTTI